MTNTETKNIDLVMQQLTEFSLDGVFFNENLLKKHNLFTEDALNLLFYNDCLDLIDYREAIDALPVYRESIKKRRKQLDATRAELFSPSMAKMMKWRYAPHDILSDIWQYGFILRQRNDYIPIKEVFKRLHIKETYSRTSIYRLLKKFNIKAMYSKKFIKMESLEMLITAGFNEKPGYKRGMKISRATYFRHKKKYCIKTELKTWKDVKSLSL